MGLFGIFDMNGPDEIYTKFKYLRRMNDSLYDGYIKDQEEVRKIYQRFCDSNDHGAKKIDVDVEKFDLILKNNFHLYLDNVDKISHCFLKMFTKYGTKNLVWNYFSNKFEGEGVKYYDIIQFHDNLPIDNLFGCKYMGIYLCSRMLEYCDQVGIAIKKKIIYKLYIICIKSGYDGMKCIK